jgi:hypothetical protein
MLLSNRCRSLLVDALDDNCRGFNHPSLVAYQPYIDNPFYLLPTYVAFLATYPDICTPNGRSYSHGWMRSMQLSDEPNGNRAGERGDNTSYHNYSGLNKVTRLTANGLTLTSSYPNISCAPLRQSTSGIDTNLDQCSAELSTS